MCITMYILFNDLYIIYIYYYILFNFYECIYYLKNIEIILYMYVLIKSI